MSETVLITGVTGLVGAPTVARFAADGWQVVATPHRRTPKDIPTGVRIPQSTGQTRPTLSAWCPKWHSREVWRSWHPNRRQLSVQLWPGTNRTQRRPRPINRCLADPRATRVPAAPHRRRARRTALIQATAGGSVGPATSTAATTSTWRGVRAPSTWTNEWSWYTPGTAEEFGDETSGMSRGRR